ncbi:MAG: hypothetical protein ABIP75_06125, partial [Pyrinomonadaceae bacterium]
MKKYIFLPFAILACATATFAQSRSLDNFDLSNGVTVATPTPIPVAVEVSPRKKGRNSLLERTAYTAPPDLVMTPGTSLDGYTTGNP